VLEGLAEEGAGAFVLAKVNVDEAPQAAARHAVRSIPLVVGFRVGKPVARFVGAQPESVVAAFLARLLPSEADQQVADGDEALAHEQLERAEDCYREALAAEPRHPGALVQLAALLGALGRSDEGLELLERVSGASAELEQRAQRLAAELRTAAARPQDERELERLRTRASQQPDDLPAQLRCARALASQRRFDEALPLLLQLVKADPRCNAHAARKAMLDSFEILGSDHPLTQEYRAALATALFR